MKVFRYTGSGYWALLVFLTAFCCAAMFGTGQGLANPSLGTNGHAGSPQQALGNVIAGLVIGTLMIGGWLALVLYMFNSRVEIQFERIAFYDMLGRQKISANLSSAKIVGGRDSVQTNVPVQITTDGGTFKVNSGLRGFRELLDEIDAQSGVTFYEIREPAPIVTYIPEFRRYTYRGSLYMWVPLLFAALGIPTLIVGAVSDHQVILAAAGLLYLCVFLWVMLSKALKEYIELGPDGIVWKDPFSQERLRAPLDSILDLSFRAPERGTTSCTVITSSGSVSFDQYLRGYNELVADLLKVSPTKREN